MILAGDIGGTNARLAFFDLKDGRLVLVFTATYPSREYTGLEQIVDKFRASANLAANLLIDAACFGVAGPVRNGRVATSNLAWVVEAGRLATQLHLPEVSLINDLEANAWGIAGLGSNDVVNLNVVKSAPVGNQAIIAAGTGLGEAGMFWDGKRHHIFACEGGHTDFGPRNELEVELFRYLHGRYGHVSYERILSGPGLVNVYHFLRDTHRGDEPAWLADEMLHGDPAVAISKAGINSTCGLCEQAVDLFVSVYGAEAGNLALKILSTGGLYLGGGIAPKLLVKLSGPLFMQSFIQKGRMQSLLEAMPVMVITNDKTALLGAARFAQSRAADQVSHAQP